MNAIFSIIYCYRNRDLDRVERSLNSLVLQDTKDFEVLFVDYGSDAEYSRAIQTLLKKFSFVKYIYNDTRGLPWNRAHALNTGIRVATTDYVFTADIDLIFAREFATVISEIKQSFSATFFSIYLLPQNYSQWDNVCDQHNLPRTTNQGLGISLIDRRVLIDQGGYNEFFTFWGYEDNELYHRLSVAGVATKFYEKNIIAYHQWHPSAYENGKIFPQGWREFMGNCYEQLRNEPVILSFSANGILHTSERKALRELLCPTMQFVALRGNLPFMRYCISQGFKRLKPGEKIGYRFRAEAYAVYRNSPAIKMLVAINSFLNNYELIPYRIQSKFEDKNISVFQVRDMIMYLLYEFNFDIEDYAIDIKDDEMTIELVVVK